MVQLDLDFGSVLGMFASLCGANERRPGVVESWAAVRLIKVGIAKSLKGRTRETNYHDVIKRHGNANERKLADFLSPKGGQLRLPVLDLIIRKYLSRDRELNQQTRRLHRLCHAAPSARCREAQYRFIRSETSRLSPASMNLRPRRRRRGTLPFPFNASN